ncbi:MAG TPA: hypothetical protein HPP65_10055, partial [Gammaproteobacteria bacterium]|nr:hypothetical protein [Gammaproteobacteria bacterium]
LGVHSSGIRWQVGCLTNVHQFDPLTTQPLLEELASGLGTPLGELSPEKHFAIVIQDGLSMKEELITASLAMQLKEVTLLGGSAGDDLQFNKTTQIINGQAVSDAAVVILGESELPFTIIKDQHYVPKGELVVVTDADVKNRRVDTLDGRAAAEVFAELVEVPYDELAAFDFGRNPLIYSERGEHYVRSIQKIEDDGALTFYCAIEPGMLLELGERESPLENLQNSLDKTETSLGSVELLFVFSGILCKLETDDQSERAYWGEMLHQFSNNVIGFDTYGEQLNGLHINQTLVAIGFHNSP